MELKMIFPLKVEAENNFESGAGRFGAPRDHGTRLHAGIDLCCDEGTPVHAVESGKVCNVYDFYLETQACSISGSKYLIRYGEITPAVKAGQMVKEGDCVGIVKKCKGLNQAMLHIEFYSNPTDKSSLTVKENKPYMRRKDLINPTEILLDLMGEK
jgi:murein DD-endopeptidase MepM/ murein hydrolase activator NlpD